ncbi:MAG: TRAP transporter small permease [Desulfobacteraceae bacterium]|nr:TRAP transporter small permease [Desulfobacteraceae bacterium]
MVNFLNKSLESIVSIFFLGIFLLTVTSVVLRYGFNTSITGANETMNYLFIYTTALGAALSLGKNTHIRISFFVDMMPPRVKQVVLILNFLVVGLFNLILASYSINWIKATGAFESPVMRIPKWMVQISIPIGCVLAAVYCLHHVAMLMLSKDARN